MSYALACLPPDAIRSILVLSCPHCGMSKSLPFLSKHSFGQFLAPSPTDSTSIIDLRYTVSGIAGGGGVL